MTTTTKNNKKVNDELVATSVDVPQKPIGVTPYQAHNIVNLLLKAHPDTYIQSLSVRPQMMYNYSTLRKNKGQKPFIPVTPEGRILLPDLEIWVNKYITKKLASVSVTE